MATIILNNGKHLKVSYDQAAHIYQILQGNEEPKTLEQAKFCEQVADVEFKSKDVEHDALMPKILQADYKHGHDKFVAVAKRINERST